MKQQIVTGHESANTYAPYIMNIATNDKSMVKIRRELNTMIKATVVGHKLKMEIRKKLDMNSYSSSKPYMVWLSGVKNGTVTQSSNLHTCRETFASDIRRNFEDDMKAEENPANFVKTGCRKLRFMFVIRHEMGSGIGYFLSQSKTDNAWMKRAVKALNIFEDHMHWAKTKIYPIKNDFMDDRMCRAYMVDGPSKWMKASALLSLYLLIIRSSKVEEIYKDFKSLKDCKKLTHGMDMDAHGNSDLYHIARSCAHWKFIMDNYEYLFDHRSVIKSIKYCWGSQGMTHFSQMVKETHCYDPVLKTRWLKLKSEKG